MNNEVAKQLKAFKMLDFDKLPTSFWLVKRKVIRQTIDYSVLRVDVDDKLQKRLKSYMKQQLQNRDFHVEEYDFNNADGDDVLLTISSAATDFTKIETAINNGFDPPHATKYDELLSSWGYVVLLEDKEKQLYAWKKINADTQPKKVHSKGAALFQNHQLVDIDDKEVFVIYSTYDFFVYNGTTFIVNKRQFESSMNFREGMIAHSEEVLSDFQKLGIFDDVNIIKEFVGSNIHHLRKLSSIRKAGYYKQSDYMKKLVAVSAREKWELKIIKGKIVVEKETVDLLLKLLNNDRLRSPINDELFDSAAKAPVSRNATAG